MTRTAIYRHYDAASALLYIGIAKDPWRRMLAHQKAQPWADEIASMSVEWHDSREQAEAAERRLILAERPSYNVHMNPASEMARFANLVGHEVLAKNLGLGISSIQNAVVRGKFPCSWGYVIACTVLDTGHRCPNSAFAWLGDNDSGHKCVSELFFPEAAS